ncbi:MAG: hypothetical protein M1348_03325 [Candidatus Parvarchaeota archaeon]|jgi:hypothetical protein|nr:hypothetical protein [Candidatus Parvarchaeota archaeon]MCL5101614.1 hypothetical protein [Candidatus Parvarchaeota archaeon]
MVDIALIAGIIIIVVAIITLLRIMKQLVEAAIIIGLIFVGSALIFHSTPVIGIPHFNLPINAGPNIIGANAGNGNTTDIAVFNAYAVGIGGFTAEINGVPVAILNSQVSINPAQIGVLVLNSSQHGEITLGSSTQLFGFNLWGLSAQYNYT